MIIEQREQPEGEIVMMGYVGNCLECFEIRKISDDEFTYWVHNRLVTPEVFRDAMALARVDQFDPTTDQFDARVALLKQSMDDQDEGGNKPD